MEKQQRLKIIHVIEKTIEIEIKSEIEKQLRGFDMLTEFNADDKQC